MRRWHLIAGLVTLIAFALTGQYMDRWHEHLRHTPDAPRLLFRSRHIYFLLAGLLNIVLGLYLAPAAARWRKRLQNIGSALILAAPALLLHAFFTEPFRADWHYQASFYGVISLFAGTLLHLITASKNKG